MNSFGSNKELNNSKSYTKTMLLMFHNTVGQFCQCGDAGFLIKFMFCNDWLEPASIVSSGDNVTGLPAEPLAKLVIMSRSPHKFSYYLCAGLLQRF